MESENPTIRQQLTKDGYSQEEKYFYDLNRDLIERQKHGPGGRDSAAAYRMKCPKCGSRMESTRLGDVSLEKCTRCQGIYLDRDAAEALIKTRKRRSLAFRLLRRLFVREGTQDLF